MDIVLREAENIFSPNSDVVGPKIASRIWGFVSKFVMLDRFAKTLFGKDFHPASPIPRMLYKEDYFGTAAKVNLYFTLIQWNFLRQLSDT